MTVTAKAAFFSAIAAAMFQFTRFPSREEKVSVAKQIVEKYPFLGTTGLGATYVSYIFVTTTSYSMCLYIYRVELSRQLKTGSRICDEIVLRPGQRKHHLRVDCLRVRRGENLILTHYLTCLKVKTRCLLKGITGY